MGSLAAPSRAGRLSFRFAPLALALALGGCATETLFQSAFNTNPVGAPPATAQATGTIVVDGAPNSVVIVPPVAGSSERWARISRTGEQAPITTMLCNFARSRGEGSYTLVAAVFLPTGSGAATFEFDTGPSASPPSTGFFHIDFLPNNTVRVNDDPNQVFGTFPRDRFFAVSITLDVGASTATAHIGLLGAGASGSTDASVSPIGLARQVGAVRVWMGFPWQGSFNVTDVLVTRRTQ